MYRESKVENNSRKCLGFTEKRSDWGLPGQPTETVYGGGYLVAKVTDELQVSAHGGWEIKVTYAAPGGQGSLSHPKT